MASKTKKKVKIEVEKNQDPQEETVVMMPEEEEGPEVGIEDLPGAVSYTHLRAHET